MIVKIVDNRFILALSVLSTVVIYFYANLKGLGLTHDSYQYWEKSVIFARNHSFKEIGFTTFFPFQSLEIVMLSIMGTNAQMTLKYLHAFFLGGTVFIHLMVAKEMFSSKKMLVIYAATLIFSTPLLMVHSFIWTEPLFIFLVSLQWYLLWLFFQRKTFNRLVAILFISLLYCWQRKAGMLFSLGLLLALTTHFVSSKKQILAIFTALALLIFILYGGLGTPNFIGEFPLLSSFSVNLQNYSDALSAWLFPLPLNYRLRVGIFTLLVIFMGYLLWKTWPEIQEEKRSYITGIVFIILTYLVIRHFYDRPHFDEADRFLAPIYPGVFFLLIFAMERFVLNTRQKILRLVLPVIMALWLTYPVIRTLKNAKMWHNRNKIPLLIEEKIQRVDKK